VALKQNSPAVDALKGAAKGLVWVSETESPLETFVWPPGPLNEEEVRKQAGVDPATAIETITLDDFFHAVSSEDKPKYDKLLQVLKQLPDVKVYRVGDEAEKKVFIVGRAFDGSRVGVRTTAVET
jgi:hypothetical protein